MLPILYTSKNSKKLVQLNRINVVWNKIQLHLCEGPKGLTLQINTMTRKT